MEETEPVPALDDHNDPQEEIRSLRARLAQLEQVANSHPPAPSEAHNPDAYQRLRFMLDSITDSYFSVDRQWRFLDVNSVAQQTIFRRPAAALIGKVIWEEFPQAVKTEFYRQYHIAFDQNRPVHFEGRSLLTGGWYEAHAYPYGDTLEIFLRDITPRKQALEALERSQEEYRQLAEEARLNLSKMTAVFDSMVEAVIIIEPNGRVIGSNPAAASMLMVETNPEPITSLNQLFPLFTCTYLDGSPCPVEEWPAVRAVGGETVSMQELNVQHNVTGRIWPSLFNATPVRDESGEVALVVCAFLDMTEHHRLAEQNRGATLQIELQRLLIQEREDERIKVAQELHDGPLQHLVGLEYELNEALSIDAKVERLVMLARLRANLREAAQVLRTYCADLRPPSLAVFGLEKAIRSHVELVNRKYPQLRIRMDLMEDGLLLSQQMRITLFRIYQELMSNVVRHSQASEVLIRLTLDEAQIELEIEDNGRGFLIPTQWIELARQNHFGLVGVQERAGAVGGRVVMRSQPDQGTLVRVIVPSESETSQILAMAESGDLH